MLLGEIILNEEARKSYVRTCFPGVSSSSSLLLWSSSIRSIKDQAERFQSVSQSVS